MKIKLLSAWIFICFLDINSAELNINKNSLSPKIVGGTSVDIKQVPFQLALLKDSKLICGAVIVNSNWAVTAAQCVQGLKITSITLRSGSSDYKTGGKVHQLNKITIHTSYNNKTSDYDIALLKVTDSLIADNSNQITLPSPGWSVAAGTQASVSGWGSSNEGGAVTNKLTQATVPVVSATECATAYGKNLITERMLCAGLITGGRGFCQGDSGGPLIADGKLIGLVSWAKGCAKPGYPGVYTNIGSLRNWIQSVSGI